MGERDPDAHRMGQHADGVMTNMPSELFQITGEVEEKS
jgi:hypothetical protein